MAGIKNDTGKIQLSLVPPELEMAVGTILSYGAKKYSPFNWREGISYSRVMDALKRHLNAYNRGEMRDSETGESHLAHAACNIAFLIAFDEHPEKYGDFNDLYPYKRNT